MPFQSIAVAAGGASGVGVEELAAGGVALVALAVGAGASVVAEALAEGVVEGAFGSGVAPPHAATMERTAANAAVGANESMRMDVLREKKTEPSALG